MCMFTSNKQRQDLNNVFRGGTKLTFKKGEFVIHPGETPSGVFFIESGLVKAYDISKYGEENLLIIRKSNEIFPLIWAVTGQERNIIYQTLEETVVWRISRSTFTKKVRDDATMLMPMLEMTLEMYRLHSEHILNLEYRTVRERLICFLINMSKRFGTTTAEGKLLIDVALKQQDIASSINASRETTSRELMRLERLGLITSNQSKITLLDLPTLKAAL
ncbi:MAG: family transcriptional regulator, cyclic receptor protein [Patescibacteria group bacterium]|nr:family transcriptional regulator, cyclic receptor protein [Patescibacteria group bacterium]